MDFQTITVTKGTLAENYERVHFIGHADYAPDIRLSELKEKQAEIYAELDAKTETDHLIFIREISIKHFPPGQTDVDFIFDVPVESPIAPIIVGIIILAIVLGTAAIVYIVWRWWTIWSERESIYYCEQDSPMTSWKGWLAYLGHLKTDHPEKYQAVQDNKSQEWWEALQPLGWGVVAVLGLLALGAARKEKD